MSPVGSTRLFCNAPVFVARTWHERLKNNRRMADEPYAERCLICHSDESGCLRARRGKDGPPVTKETFYRVWEQEVEDGAVTHLFTYIAEQVEIIRHTPRFDEFKRGLPDYETAQEIMFRDDGAGLLEAWERDDHSVEAESRAAIDLVDLIEEYPEREAELRAMTPAERWDIRAGHLMEALKDESLDTKQRVLGERP